MVLEMQSYISILNLTSKRIVIIMSLLYFIGNNMDTSEIKKMSKNEKLQAIEALWDSLLIEEHSLPSPDWHEDVLKVREAKIKDGSAKLISLSDLKKNNR